MRDALLLELGGIVYTQQVRCMADLLGVDDAAELEEERVRMLFGLHLRAWPVRLWLLLGPFRPAPVACAFTLSMKPMALPPMRYWPLSAGAPLSGHDATAS